MSDPDEAIHTRLVELAGAPAGGHLIDLGCGAGPTLLAAARSAPHASLTGVDRSLDALAAARAELAGHRGEVRLIEADLRNRLPLPDSCADAVVTYNTLECLPEPLALLDEVNRILRPEGRAVLAHVDFDTIVVAGPDPALDRRVCHAFTDDQQSWMDHADGRIGRKLPGLVTASALTLDTVDPSVYWSTCLEDHARERLTQMRSTLDRAASNGRTKVTADDVAEWFNSVQAAGNEGRFFFAESAFIVVARKSMTAPH